MSSQNDDTTENDLCANIDMNLYKDNQYTICPVVGQKICFTFS